MPTLIMEEEASESYTPHKDNFTQQASPRSTLSPRSIQSDSIDLAIDGVVDTSIEQLYTNVYEMRSSDQSPSRASFYSYGEESRIDSELCHLVGDIVDLEITKEIVTTESKEDSNVNAIEKVIVSSSPRTGEGSSKSVAKSRSLHKRNEKGNRKGNGFYNMMRKYGKLGLKDGIVDELDNPDLGPLLLKITRDMLSSGENPNMLLVWLLEL